VKTTIGFVATTTAAASGSASTGDSGSAGL
jgi:hypothetical protein